MKFLIYINVLNESCTIFTNEKVVCIHIKKKLKANGSKYKKNSLEK